MKILCAALGGCVHIAGLLRFSQLAQEKGHHCTFLGGAVPIDKVIGSIIEIEPDMVALSYRLSPNGLRGILNELFQRLSMYNTTRTDFWFGGTPETVGVARGYEQFTRFFDGGESEKEVIQTLTNTVPVNEEIHIPPQTVVERIKWKAPNPLIRHHIGLPTLRQTSRNIRSLAKSGLLDIISLAPDQNAQQYWFHPDKMDPTQDGAGGAPFRDRKDFQSMYMASRTGNYPLLRCYSGTQDIIPFSQMLIETIQNAWAAIPLTWYSEMDRRSERPLGQAISENQEAIRYNAEKGLPVEINEAHQWGLRFAHDAMEVAVSAIAVHNAKVIGVKDYIMQFMLCTPPEISPAMDLAKALAKWEMALEIVQTPDSRPMRIIKMIRTGLLSFRTNLFRSIGQLNGSMMIGSFLRPEIVHVVAYCEAIRRASSREIIESATMVQQIVEESNKGCPDCSADPIIRDRKEYLKDQAYHILDAIRNLDRGFLDPLCDPAILERAIQIGILDAPGLGTFGYPQKTRTQVVHGRNEAIDDFGQPISERKRLAMVFDHQRKSTMNPTVQQ